MRKLFLLFLLYSTFCFAQEELTVNYNREPLKTVLTDIQNKTGYLFSFSEDLISNSTITIPSKTLKVTDLIAILEVQTGLDFQTISEKKIIIKTLKINVCGYVLSKASKAPLAFANVLVKGTSVGTITKESGFFEIQNVSPSSTILIQFLGYQEASYTPRELQDNNCKNLYLVQDIQTLNHVVLTAYVTKGLNKNNDGSTTVTNDELSISPGLTEPDVFQSLQLIPGITSLNDSASDIQIRGGSQDQNLIHFDNIKLYNTGHFFGMISSINPYIVEQTKVFKGGASPEYGDRVSGIIDITSANKVMDSTQAGIGLNGIHADAFLKTPIGKSFGLLLSARRSYTDLLRTPTYDAIANKVFQNTKVITNTSGQVIGEDNENGDILGEDRFYFYDTNIKLIAEPTKDDVVSFSGMLTKNNLNFSTQDDENTASDQLNIENQGASIRWEGEKFGKLQYAFTAYYSKFDSFYSNVFRDEGVIEEENLRKNAVEERSFDAQLEYEFVPRHAIKLGYQYTTTDVFFQLFRDELDDNIIDPDDDDEIVLSETRDFNEIETQNNRSNSFYGEYVFRPKKNGHISLGLRASHFSFIDNYFIEPRINVEYPISKSIRLKATGERRYQTISQIVEFEDTQIRLENQIWTLSDGDETPVLDSNQFSGGILLDYNDWVFELDLYTKQINGLTSFTNGFTNASEDFSVGKSSIFGLDLLLKKTLQNWSTWLGYTFNNIDYTFSDLQSGPFPGNNDITHNLRLNAVCTLEKWQFSAGWRFRSGAPFTPVESFDPANEDINFGPINSSRLPNYHRLDMSIFYNFPLSTNNRIRGNFGVALQNVYARRVPISVFYRTDTNPDTGEDELDRLEQLSLGFTPNVTLRISF